MPIDREYWRYSNYVYARGPNTMEAVTVSADRAMAL